MALRCTSDLVIERCASPSMYSSLKPSPPSELWVSCWRRLGRASWSSAASPPNPAPLKPPNPALLKPCFADGRVISEGLLPSPPKLAERPTEPPRPPPSAGALALPASAHPPARARRRSSRLRCSALFDRRPPPAPPSAPGPTEVGRDCGVEALTSGRRTRR
eukprot:scaffold77432_cov60-Phaeocystis_antarctica.AAC.2